METRKVYRSGGSTLVVSLPKRWAKRAGVKDGDSILVRELEGSLLLTTGEPERKHQREEIDSKLLDSPEDMKLLIISHYLAGYERLIVKFNRSQRLDYKKDIREAIEFLIGLEIAEEYDDRLLLEVFLDQERISTMEALKRMYLIIKSMLKDAQDVIGGGDEELARDIITREKEVDRLYFLIVRQLKSAVRYGYSAEKLGIREQREALGYRIVVKSFERISDHVENLVENFLALRHSHPDMRGAQEIMAAVIDLLDDASRSVFRKDQDLALGLFQSLEKIKERYQKASKEIFKKDLTLEAAIHYKGMLDSLSRIADYASDIAEIAINISVAMP